jgi:hypothetical protein
MNRRSVLKGGAILAVTAHSAAVAPALSQDAVSVDGFLATASATEKRDFLAKALADVMQEISPDSYRTIWCDKHHFLLICKQ